MDMGYEREQLRMNIKKISSILVALAVLAVLTFASGRVASAEALTLPAALHTIEAEAFMGDTSIKRVVIPEGVTFIGVRAFYGCTGLTEITLPVSLTEIADDAFEGCSGFSVKAVPGSYAYEWCVAHGYMQHPALTPVEDLVYTVTDDQYVQITGYTGADTIICIPEEIDGYPVQKIADNAFRGNQSVQYAYLPDNVISIGSDAFEGCTSLMGVDVGKRVEEIRSGAFQNCPSLPGVIFPDTLTATGDNLFRNCTNLAFFDYPLNWQSVGSNTLAGCTKVTEILIPEGVEAIPAYAFNGMKQLLSVELPSTLKRIGNCAFQNCTEIASFDLPDGLEFIGTSAFAGCASLTAALLPDSVTAIGTNAYENCANLETFRYPMSLSSVYSDTLNRHRIFHNCKKLERIVVPEGITEIPANLFNGSNCLKCVELPSTLKRINNKAFQDCTAIENLDLPDGLEFIGTSAFAGCTSLTAALLPDSVTAIGTNAYENCVSLATFHYPLSLQSVHSDTFTRHRIFRACKMLACISIPAGVTGIPARLFDEANYLKYLDVPDTVQRIGDKAFNGCTSFEKLYLGYNVTSIGKNNFTNCPALTIWTEYGAVAHKYAVNNGNAYYYLTPDGVNIPSGTLYRGDAYPLYGYARASINLTDITATIWDSTGTTALQSISIAPGITDYSMSSGISSGLDFASLPLGSYRYTLRASTDISEELWADSTFRIVPPPLRVSRIGLDIPYGLYGYADDVPVAGTIVANYPISQIIVGVYDDNDAPTAQVYISSPNRTSFDLSEAGLSVGTLPSGSYVFKVIVSGNGETVTAVCSDFTLSGASSIDASDVDRDALSVFLANAENRRPFANVNYYGSLEASLTDFERLKYAMYTSDKKIRSGMIDMVLGGLGINDSRRNEYLVTLYKEEITSYIKSQGLIGGKFEFQEVRHEETIGNFIELHQLKWDQIKEDLGFAASDYEKEYVAYVNDLLKDVDWSLTTAQQMRDLAGYAVDALLDYTQGIQVLDTLAADVLSPSEWNYNYQLAVRELKDEYTSNSKRLWHNLFKYAADKCAEEGHEKLVECAIKGLAGGEVYIAYKITMAVWTFYTEETGFYDDVAKLDKYRAQVETFNAAYQNYMDCFDALSKGQGDDKTIARMIQCFEQMKIAGIRSMSTLKTIPMHTRFVTDGELYRLTLEFQKKHCP